MSLDDGGFSTGGGGFSKGRTTQPDDYGKSPQAAALRRQLAKLAELETTPVYREMSAAAERTIMAGGSYATHGWGEYGANGDPRKRRKARA